MATFLCQLIYSTDRRSRGPGRLKLPAGVAVLATACCLVPCEPVGENLVQMAVPR